MSFRAVALCTAVTATSLLAGPAVADAHHDFRIAPKVGKPKTRFKLTFTADLTEVGSAEDPLEFYIAHIRGPRGCRDVEGFLDVPAVTGQPARIALRPTTAIFPLHSRSTWCPGRYRGSMRFCHCATGDTRPDVVFKRFSFKVKKKKRKRR